MGEYFGVCEGSDSFDKGATFCGVTATKEVSTCKVCGCGVFDSLLSLFGTEVCSEADSKVDSFPSFGFCALVFVFGCFFSFLFLEIFQ